MLRNARFFNPSPRTSNSRPQQTFRASETQVRAQQPRYNRSFSLAAAHTSKAPVSNIQLELAEVMRLRASGELDEAWVKINQIEKKYQTNPKGDIGRYKGVIGAELLQKMQAEKPQRTSPGKSS